ncbi:MAG: hypothetical protein JXA46_13105 [Dehalococcoidales bacterium]|nr:hypothetical protein [Dehalococcoidales bacterium]
MILADEIVLTLLILLLLWRLNVPLTWPVFVLLFCFFIVAVFIIHRLVIPGYHRKTNTGRESLVGLQGFVIETLNPGGTVKVKGEYWKAESLEGIIFTGENVEVTGSAGLVLKVKRLASRRI